LNTQARKASTSATANIAEGYGRYHYQEGIQFYRIARGSIFELRDHLISCSDNDYIDVAVFEKGMSLIDDALLTLNGYIKYVQKQKTEGRQDQLK
jgi:four helix bundle protein